MTRGTRSAAPVRPVLYQLGRAGERFTVGEGPFDLAARARPTLIGRRDGDEDTDVGAILVDDPWMSFRHARIVDGGRTPTTSTSMRFVLEDCGSKNGIVINGRASQRAPLVHGDIIETGRTFWVYVEERGVEPLLSAPVELGAMATWHPRLGQQLLAVQARAQTPEHLLVSGPPGAGKGFLARTVHQVSRREGRLLHLDCRERGPRKLTVDLFGAAGGPQGKLRDASLGTLLLENVDALAPDLQDRLADALRRRAFVPDGKTRPVVLDVRVVATVDRPVEELVAAGALRRELVDMIGLLRVDMPPLHERACDLGLLLDDFMTRARGAVAIAREAVRVLFRYRFPHHVRGFCRVIEAAASLAAADDRRRKGGMIELRHLPFSVAGPDAMRLLLAQANHLADGQEDADVKDDTDDLTGEQPALSATGDEVALFDAPSEEAAGFSSVIATDAEQQRPVLSSVSGGPRRTTASAIDPPVWAEAEDVDVDALVAALRTARGNVSAAARALRRPRALVLRWLRDLNLDPVSYR